MENQLGLNTKTSRLILGHMHIGKIQQKNLSTPEEAQKNLSKESRAVSCWEPKNLSTGFQTYIEDVSLKTESDPNLKRSSDLMKGVGC